MKRMIWVIVGLFMSVQSCAQNQPDKSFIKKAYLPSLEDAYTKARSLENVRSLLVSHKGKLVSEEYFGTFPIDSLEHVRSVTKSVMATLIGIAIDKGYIKSVDESIATYLGDEAKSKEGITIKHVLSMTSGIEWQEVMADTELDAWRGAPNQTTYILNKLQESAPGENWEYSTGIIHLLSPILANATGMSTLEFANKYLFKPLDIENVGWIKLKDGHYSGGSRLQLKPRDMIKIGQLYANKGVFNGKRIVSESFIKEATSPQNPPGQFGGQGGYGYAWWIGEGEGVKGYMAQGYGGQTILVVPEEELVIVVTYTWRVSAQKAADQQQEATNVLAAAVVRGIANNK